MIKLKAAQLRNIKPEETDLRKIKKNPIYIVLDNVLDTYNVGAIFRLADAVAAQKVILCGQTETPPNTRIKKASINTTEWVPWQYAPSAKEAIAKLKVKSEKLKVVAIEQDKRSVPYDKFNYQFPIA
ncbi:MAG: TrmH family RNA methyltransferase, partial [Candidatus Levyibacteriota bacterium]